MDAIGLFDDERLWLPLKRCSHDEDLSSYMDRVFKSFLEAYDELDGADSLTQRIKQARPKANQLCSDLSECVKRCFAGEPYLAFGVLSEALERVGEEIESLRSSNVAGDGLPTQLYRLRSIKEPMPYRRKDIFHVPFEFRHLVGSQRYSIPGLPCLYLGATTYICWEELNRPRFHSLYAARFKAAPGADIGILDFSVRPGDTARRVDQERHADGSFPSAAVFVARAVCWPLIAACSIRRLHRQAPFIAEYAVPQLLLQWIASPNRSRKRLDGIAYFSVRPDPRLDVDAERNAGLVNFVFPVQEAGSHGFCPILREKFELSEPVAWGLIPSIGLEKGKIAHGETHIAVVPHIRSNYLHTEFGQAESRLVGLPTTRLADA